MEARASARYQPLSARKARLVVDLIRGVPVNQALDTLRFCRARASKTIDKVIRSALATAVVQFDADADNLYVTKVWVDEGPMRYWRFPRMRGMWTRIRRRTSHIHIVLADKPSEVVGRESGAKPKSGRKRK